MNKFTIIFVMSFFFISFSEKVKGLEMLKGDDPGKFNWTNPDLFRWRLGLGEKHDNYIDDKEEVVLKSKKWACKVSETKRRTWLVEGNRYFSEYRKVTCSSDSFTSQIETTCKLGLMGKKVILVHANSARMDVGSGKDLNLISLECKTWHDHNQNNKNDSFEWRGNVHNWEPGKCGECLWD